MEGRVAAARNQEFVVEDSDGPVPRRVAAALEPRFTVIQERRRSARQTWLDTFDWRLHAAGLVLHQITDERGTERASEQERQRANGRTGELVLRTAGGEPVASAAVSAPRWPGLLDVIPAGPLRDRLEPVVGVRALLPLARAQDKQTLLRVLDGEHKTVARITLDAATVVSPAVSPAFPPAVPPARAGVLALPVRLLLAPVRGYQVDADRAGRLLAEAGGFAPAQSPAYESVLAAAGRRPGDYTDKVDLSLAASMPARVALARVLLRLAETIAANAGFVVRDVDIEFLHDLRVAVRRTRSALKLAGDALPGELAACYAPEFKWLGDLTTPTRDLDVYLAGFGQMAAGLRAAEPDDLEPLRGYLTARRAAEQRVLLRGLRSERFHRLMTSWRAALEDAALESRPASHDIASHDIASHDIASHDIAGHDIAGHDIASHDIAGHDIAGHDIAGH
ncbi:MAG TPA: CHAD domain-containing protein, partial [Streptosporangiaceae bacterium]|nr:CHAD domain-containing protein [Streptosporangiaceae bacterium]